MAFRNPLTSLPASGIVGQIQGSQLAADSINGKTITGATIQTAAAGQRISMLPPGGAYTDDRLQMDSGGGEAKPSFLKAFPPASDTSIQTVLSSADLTPAGINQGAVLVLKSGNNTNEAATVATLQAESVNIEAVAPDGTKGALALTGSDVTLNGASLPRGAESAGAGVAQLNASAVLGATTYTAIPGLAVTVTVPAGRRLKLSVVAGVYSSVSGDRARLYITEAGTTTLQTLPSDPLPVAGGVYPLSGFAIVTPAAGTHTYSLYVDRYSGTGGISVYGAAGWPSIFTVEDIGPA